MAECQHLARTTAYFDGALAPADEAAATEHLATCAECQAVLGDAVAIDAVLSAAPKQPQRQAVRRRWPLVVAIAGGLAVAAAATVIAWPRAKPTETTIALANERAIEARFTGEQFGRHRPLGVLRGDRRVESITLAQLAQLEGRRAHRDLVAALAATGDLERARTVIASLPDDAASESDRAAVALAVRDHEGAVAHALRAIAKAPELAPAWWNLALATRELGLARTSKAAFERVAATGEPGWADEARAQATALDKELAGEIAFAAFDKRGRVMVDGGAPIDVADVRRFPAFARVYTLDALRTASGPRIDELRPLAKELDALSGAPTMIGAADRAAAADAATRAKFAERYRAVVARTLAGPELEKLVDELRAAGAAVDDLRASAIILGGLGRARNAELRAIVAPWRDPWFDIVVERERIRASFPNNDLRAEPALVAALASCTDAWNLRCGQLAQDLAQLLRDTGRPQEAEAWATKAISWFRTGVAPVHLATARALLGDIHRHLGRAALARVELEDVTLVADAGCALKRYASIALADLAFADGDWARVRAALPAPVPPAGCVTQHEIQGIGTAADLARHTKDAADRTRAQDWIDAAAASADPEREGNMIVAKARIGDAAALSAVRAWAARPATTPRQQELRTWAFTTLLADAGARGAWADAIAIAREEHPAAAAPCSVVLSFDDGVLTVAVQTPDHVTGSHRPTTPTALSTEPLVESNLVAGLARCPAIAVSARSPLHGRADVLPPALPWWFAGDAPAHERGTPARAVEVTNPRAPDLALPPLATAGASSATFDVSLTGAAATPSRVLAALTDATYVELHAHGIAASTVDATAFLALSPDADGTFALRADALRTAKLGRAPIVVLAACRAAAVAPMLRARWSLPDAFLAAGAHAVVATDIPIPDASARRVFDELHRRLDAGESVAAAVAAIRAAAHGDTAWATHLMVFR